jgi:hypothetical protein
MRASSIVLLTALIVLLGKWSKGESVNAKIIVGGLFAALMISMLDSAQPKLAKGFAWLFFAGAALNYTGSILGNTVGASSTSGTPVGLSEGRR